MANFPSANFNGLFDLLTNNIIANPAGSMGGVWLCNLNASTQNINIAGMQEQLANFQPYYMEIDNVNGVAAVIVNETIVGWSKTVAAGQKVGFNYPGNVNGNQNFNISSVGVATPIIYLYNFSLTNN